jgi:HK97 family phage portal protein
VKVFGFEITRAKAVSNTGPLQAVHDRGWTRVLESFAGAWQRNIEITVTNVTTHPAVFACTTLMANDIAKMRLRLVQEESPGVWVEVENPAFSPVLRKPNHYQNRLQFIAQWVISKQLHGNTYVLKVRDKRGIVTALYVLDPTRIRPLVSPSGEVFYELKRDDLSQLPLEAYVVPAREIIHDHWNELFHPLVGLSPIYACGLAAVHGLNIHEAATYFFENGARPGGVLTAPGSISDATATRLKTYFDDNFTGENTGKIAVLGDGLKYESMMMTAVDAQMIEQLKWASETICSVYHVPAYMAGFGPPPNYNNIEALSQQYYSQCLQFPIEGIELCLDEGLGLTEGDVASKRYGTEFDLSDLLRMDTATRLKAASDALASGMSHNEVRRLYHGLGPVPGGESPMSQQQNFSLQALAERDKDKPFAKPTPAPAAPPADQSTPPSDASDDPADDETKAALVEFYLRKELVA